MRRFRAFLGKGWVIEKSPIIVKDNNEVCDNPIFVIGTHRSGTSLIRRILDSHPNIACPPESYYIAHYTSILEDERSINALINYGYTEDEIYKGLRKSASYFHEMYRVSKNKKRWADKTPQYVYHLNTIEKLYKKSCKYVFVIRHPLDVAYSLYKRGWELEGLIINTGDRIHDICKYVAESGKLQINFIETFPDNIFRVYYEDLMENPENILNNLCEFIQEPWSDTMLKHHEHKHDFGTEDPVSRGTKGFSISSENWYAWKDVEISNAWSILKEISIYHGYNIHTAKRNA
jgi:LPS sulfotransferase NodH